MATVIRERRVITGGYDGILIVHRILNTLLTIVNVFLVIRLILKALGANASATFVNFIYSVTGPIIAPFSGMFSNPPIILIRAYSNGQH